MPASIHMPARRVGLLALSLGLPLVAAAQQDFEITRHSVLPAAEMAGGPFTLRGTAGQPAAARAEAGGLRVQGGFHRAARAGERIFDDGFETPSAPLISAHDATPEDPT